MARIRTIKPEFWSSPGLPADPWERLLFVAMWNWADDYGIGSANERELLGFAFPNDDQITIADLRRMLAGIRRSFGVKFYTVGGRPYYSIPSWEDHQKIDRRAARRNPGPEDAETQLYTEIPPTSPRVPAESVPICHESPESDGDTPYSRAEQHPPTSPRNPPDNSVGSRGVSGVGKGTEDLGKGTEEVGTEEDDSPPEPTHLPAEPEFVDAIAVPEFIESAARPSKPHPTNAALTVVRQELGGVGYPQDTLKRLAVQVQKLAHQGHPDVVIRESLHEWDSRPDCDKPEFLPTVYSDVVKRSRAAPPMNGHDAKVNDYLAFANQPTQREIEQ